MCSWFHASAPGSLTSSAPVWRLACHTPTAPPAGCMTNAIRPASMTSIGSTITMPPASVARVTTASASSVATYVDQIAGCSALISGPMPAICLPRSWNMA